ncbi:MAG: transcriptional regulator [Candidatus Methanomethylophilaceae archaeon]
MSRAELIESTRTILTSAGYDVSSTLNLRSVCFDIVARRDDKLLIIKILSNVDAFSRENAEEMKVLAEALKASPLLIGERSSSGVLELGIVYSRFNIPIISNETLAEHTIEEVPPLIFAAPGGLYVRLDGDMLKQIRNKEGLSLGVIAEMAGVSRRTVQMYESGMGAMIDAALRIEEFLNTPMILPLDPFAYKTEDTAGKYEIRGDTRTGSYILNKLLEIGFSVTPVMKSPFDALSRVEEVIILTATGTDEGKLIQRALVTSEVSNLAGRPSVVIVERARDRENIKTTAVISTDELGKIDDSEELTDLVLARSSKK